VSGRVSADTAAVFREELSEGFSVEGVASRYGVSPATVKKHASFNVGGRQLLLGTEVHIAGQRGRWEFRGGIGMSAKGEQYADFVNVRTGRCRTFYTHLIGTVHRKGGG